MEDAYAPPEHRPSRAAVRAVCKSQPRHPLTFVVRNMGRIERAKRKIDAAHPSDEGVVAQLRVLIELSGPEETEVHSETGEGAPGVLQVERRMAQLLNPDRIAHLTEILSRRIESVGDCPPPA